MQYHLETIPVWEAMEEESGCPLCVLYRKCEEAEIDKSLGGSVMEPDVRIRVNERGICADHHRMLFAMQNRLGHALLTDSHTKELKKKLDDLERLIPCEKKRKRSLFGAKKDLSVLTNALEGLISSCVICEAIESHMQRYLYTFVHLWKTDTAFRQRWEQSKGVCLPHATALLKQADGQLNDANKQAFSKSVVTLLKDNLNQDENDLEWFTQKFDYRNHDKPWGQSKNALERCINRLRGLCILPKGE